MDDWRYLLALGFSGADLTRALWLGLTGVLLVSKTRPPRRVLLLVLAVDTVWPLGAMMLGPHDAEAVAASGRYLAANFPSNLVAFCVRGLGFYVVFRLGYALRSAVAVKPLPKPQRGAKPQRGGRAKLLPF